MCWSLLTILIIFILIWFCKKIKSIKKYIIETSENDLRYKETLLNSVQNIEDSVTVTEDEIQDTLNEIEYLKEKQNVKKYVNEFLDELNISKN